MRGELGSIALESGQRLQACLGARDDAVVVRGRNAKKETVVLITNIDAIRDRAAQTQENIDWVIQEGRTWSHQEGQDPREARAPQWRRSESSSI